MSILREYHALVQEVYQAKHDADRADALIRRYLPFIRSQAAKVKGAPCSEQEDEYSIALIAFHEAIQGYERLRGNFTAYAALRIRSRILDFYRRERRHQGLVSLHAAQGEDEHELLEDLADPRNRYEESAARQATRQEIGELSEVLARFGVTFADVSANCPRQERTLSACRRALQYAMEHRELLEELLRTGKLPLAALVQGSGVERKTLERHRKYLLALLLIQTNGYEIIRGHLHSVLMLKGGETK